MCSFLLQVQSNDNLATEQQIASVIGHLLEEKGKLECLIQQVNA